MEIIKKYWRLTSVVVFALFYLVFALTAKSILEGGTEIREDEREDEVVEKIRDVNVDLVISGGGINFRSREAGTSNDTVGDMLERARESGRLVYEQVAYINETRITSINRVENSGNMEWVVYSGSEEVKDFTKHKLVSNEVYSVRLELVAK